MKMWGKFAIPRESASAKTDARESCAVLPTAQSRFCFCEVGMGGMVHAQRVDGRASSAKSCKGASVGWWWTTIATAKLGSVEG